MRIDDVEEDCAESETEAATRFDLPRIHTFDAAADNFGNVGSGIQAECDDGDKNLVDVDG